MINDYRIEALISLFSKHADLSDEQHKEHVKQYKENFPNQKLPKHMQKTFNLPRALSAMAYEIVKLKQKEKRYKKTNGNDDK